MTPAYDISQTAGQDMRTFHLADDSKEMEAALRTLIELLPRPVVPDQEIEAPHFMTRAIWSWPSTPTTRTVKPSPESPPKIAHARFHDRGKTVIITGARATWMAQSVSYNFVRHFGVNRELPDLSRLPELYPGLAR